LRIEFYFNFGDWDLGVQHDGLHPTTFCKICQFLHIPAIFKYVTRVILALVFETWAINAYFCPRWLNEGE
jgi:hypothetical protein